MSLLIIYVLPHASSNHVIYIYYFIFCYEYKNTVNGSIMPAWCLVLLNVYQLSFQKLYHRYYRDLSIVFLWLYNIRGAEQRTFSNLQPSCE